jgi:DNA-binding transcriptional regulator YiaG
MTPAAVLSARQTMGMTQEQFAAALGVKRRTVINWEQGHTGVSGPVELAIAAMLCEKGESA